MDDDTDTSFPPNPTQPYPTLPWHRNYKHQKKRTTSQPLLNTSPNIMQSQATEDEEDDEEEEAIHTILHNYPSQIPISITVEGRFRH